MPKWRSEERRRPSTLDTFLPLVHEELMEVAIAVWSANLSALLSWAAKVYGAGWVHDLVYRAGPRVLGKAVTRDRPL